MQINITAANLAQFFKEAMRNLLPSPERDLRRRQQRAERLRRYRMRNASYPYSGKRQQQRYARQNMREQQRNSHKPGTVQPRHIFGA